MEALVGTFNKEKAQVGVSGHFETSRRSVKSSTGAGRTNEQIAQICNSNFHRNSFLVPSPAQGRLMKPKYDVNAHNSRKPAPLLKFTLIVKVKNARVVSVTEEDSSMMMS